MAMTLSADVIAIVSEFLLDDEDVCAAREPVSIETFTHLFGCDKFSETPYVRMFYCMCHSFC